ncbi:MAG TPA: glucokinase [Thermodesulfobacteriota bacterium]
MRSRLILAGDIGGTKTYMAIFELRGATLGLVREASFSNARYSGPAEIFRQFLKAGEATDVTSAALGIACPIAGDVCRLTNFNWVVDRAGLKKEFGLRDLALINDLAAIGWGVGLLPEDDLHVLQKGRPSQGNAALIAAGTGLGEAILFWDGKAHLPSASEGGHTDFGPRNALEVELLKFLIEKYGHVSYERIVSGPGIENVYEFVRSRRGTETERLKKRFEAEGMAAVISDEAINGTDEGCREALGLFLCAYGAEAGNLALKSLALAGVYIGGGIAPRILKALSDGRFLDAFRDKGRYDGLMSNIPVYVILNDRTGLMGAARYAASLVEGATIKTVSGMGRAW